MNIGILAWEPDELESLQLVSAARRLGHSPLLFTFDDVAMRSGEGEAAVLIGDVRVEDLDVILARTHLRPERWRSDEELLMLLSDSGTPIIHPASVHVPVKSKLWTMRRLSAAGFRVPPTRLCRTLADVAAALRASEGSLVVKPSYGSGGDDVEHVTGELEPHRELVAGLLERHGSLLAQPYVPHPDGDVRTTVVGDDVAFSFRRTPPPGGWKTNIAAGGSPSPYSPPPAVRELSVAVARTLGLSIAGLDIVEQHDGHLIFEVNTSPGWHPLPVPEQHQAAERMIEHAVARVRRATDPVVRPNR